MLDEKATDTHSKYVILDAFVRQKWLQERAWLLCLSVHYVSCSVVSLDPVLLNAQKLPYVSVQAHILL